jgi:restriction endonuclease Mrr
MTNYKEIPMSEFENRDREIVNAVIHEGEMRQGEKVIALLERKITEAYANNNKELADFLENLIVEIEGI